VYRPNSLYSATKQAFDDVLAYYSWTAQLEVVTLRIYDSYGPGDERGKVLSALLRAAASGEPLEMSSGQALIDLVHVDDVVEALLLAATTPVTSGAAPTRYALSSGAPLRVRELVDLVSQVTGREVPVQWGARPDRADEMREPWDAGPPVPGWKPRIALRDGITALAD
jgi:nucleoside-diphosphate-sugar epimerase